MTDESSIHVQKSKTGVVLPLRVVPGSQSVVYRGVHDGCLKLAVVAPPENGKANLAVVKWIAKFFGMPRSNVMIVAGLNARTKRVELVGANVDQVKTKIRQLG